MRVTVRMALTQGRASADLLRAARGAGQMAGGTRILPPHERRCRRRGAQHTGADERVMNTGLMTTTLMDCMAAMPCGGSFPRAPMTKVEKATSYDRTFRARAAVRDQFIPKARM